MAPQEAAGRCSLSSPGGKALKHALGHVLETGCAIPPNRKPDTGLLGLPIPLQRRPFSLPTRAKGHVRKGFASSSSLPLAREHLRDPPPPPAAPARPGPLLQPRGTSPPHSPRADESPAGASVTLRRQTVPTPFS